MGDFKSKTPGPRAIPSPSGLGSSIAPGRAGPKGHFSVPVRPSCLSLSLAMGILFMFLPALALFPSLCFCASFLPSIPKSWIQEPDPGWWLFRKIPSSRDKVLLAQPGSRSCPWFNLWVQQGGWACTPASQGRKAMLGVGGGLSRHPGYGYNLLPMYPARRTTGMLTWPRRMVIILITLLVLRMYFTCPDSANTTTPWNASYPHHHQPHLTEELTEAQGGSQWRARPGFLSSWVSLRPAHLSATPIITARICQTYLSGLSGGPN